MNRMRTFIGRQLCALVLLMIRREQEYDGRWIVSDNTQTLVSQKTAFRSLSERTRDRLVLSLLATAAKLLTKKGREQKVFVSVPSQHYPID